MESKMGQTEQSNRYGFRLNHNTKRASICTIYLYTKCYFTHRYEKKIIHLWQTVVLQRHYRQQCILKPFSEVLQSLKAFSSGICTDFSAFVQVYQLFKVKCFSFLLPHINSQYVYSLSLSVTTTHKNTLSVKHNIHPLLSVCLRVHSERGRGLNTSQLALWPRKHVKKLLQRMNHYFLCTMCQA